MRRIFVLLLYLIVFNFDTYAYTITVNVHEHGSALCNGITLRGESRSFEVDANTEFQLVLTPDEGYTSRHFSGGGWHYWPDKRQTPTNASFVVYGDDTIEVYFDDVNLPDEYSLTISAKGNGIVSEYYSKQEIRNASITITFDSRTPYHAYILLMR